jgi:hypothetical protein
MSETQADRIPPTLEVRVLRDGVVVERQLCENDAEASAVVEAWSDVEGVVVEVEDLIRDAERTGVLEPRPWEVDAAEPGHEPAYPDEEE